MKMEDYLGTLTDEWRDIAPLWRDGPAPRDLERVRAFVARSGEHAADFALFDGYFHTAERLLAQYSNAATSN
jgi:hypothetical protein